MAVSSPHLSSPQRFAWLTVTAALMTIALKAWAYLATGSVGLLSDALESVVNLAAALVSLVVLWIAAKAPDEEHAYGHYKAEYFSSGLEGTLVIVAAGSIAWAAVPRLVSPQGIEQLGTGVIISLLASMINGGVAWRLFRAAREFRSITLLASARHLMTDVWTSVGVVGAVVLVSVTGWNRLDPIVALLMAANIVWIGWKLVDKSVHGLLDTALPESDLRLIEDVLSAYRGRLGIETHALRTREAGSRRFMSVHVLVPGSWTVRRGHQLMESIEHDILAELPGTTVLTHMEPLDDPVSWEDVSLDRANPPGNGD